MVTDHKSAPSSVGSVESDFLVHTVLLALRTLSTIQTVIMSIEKLTSVSVGERKEIYLGILMVSFTQRTPFDSSSMKICAL